MTDLNDVGTAIEHWFAGGLAAHERVVELMSADERRRKAALLEALSTNASLLDANWAKLDDDEERLSLVCRLLSAACLLLGFAPSRHHWRAAVDNVTGVRAQLKAQPTLFPMTSTSLFADSFRGALENAGVTDRPSALSDKDRRHALGLAINWGLRLLLALALEARTTGTEPSMTLRLREILAQPPSRDTASP